MSWVRKLFTLPGTERNAALVLHQTLDKLPRIKNVVIVIQWDDDSFAMDSSDMKNSELWMASLVMHREVLKDKP